MNSFKLQIPFSPRPKASVRMGINGAYNPSSRGMKQVSLYAQAHINSLGRKALSGPLLVIYHFLMPQVKQLAGYKRLLLASKPHCKKPDGDNLEKFLNDAFNGILWSDDAQIAWMLRSKSYAEGTKGSITIFACEIPNEKCDPLLIQKIIQENMNYEMPQP